MNWHHQTPEFKIHSFIIFRIFPLRLHFDDITKLRKHFSLGSYPQLCLFEEWKQQQKALNTLWTVLEWKMEKHTSSSTLTGQAYFELASISYDATVERFQVNKQNVKRRKNSACTYMHKACFHIISQQKPVFLFPVEMGDCYASSKHGFFGSTLW